MSTQAQQQAHFKICGMVHYSFQTKCVSERWSDFLQKGELVVNSVSVKEKELPLTPPSDGLAAHLSSPGAVLVSRRVTEIHA